MNVEKDSSLSLSLSLSHVNLLKDFIIQAYSLQYAKSLKCEEWLSDHSWKYHQLASKLTM